MKTFILFIYGTFETHEEIEFFCMEVFSNEPTVNSLKYVIEGSNNVIILFDSNLEHKEIADHLYDLMKDDPTIKFYFMFELEKLVTAHLPEQIKDLMFKPNPELTALRVEYSPKVIPLTFDLDEVLDKIEKQGIESLTIEEKKFLDNFEY